MKAWEWVWFQKLIEWLRKWPWFERYGWSGAKNLEDFVRNPFDGLWRSLSVKGIKPLSLINFRIYYVTGDKWTGFNLNLLSPWVTKFSNCWLWFQISLSMKGWLPIPCIMLHFRPTYHRYFQAAFGMAPDRDKVTGEWFCMPYGKFRFVNDKTSNEILWNPTDQTGWNEGTI